MSAEPPRRMLDIPSLDGLRALSISIVFVSHAGYSIVPGGLGVSIFFVISGFLITTLLCGEFDRTGSISLHEFYIRHAFRILPVFYVVLGLGVVAVATGLIGDGLDADATASQFLHYFNFYAISHDGYSIVPGTGVYWSLAIEEHFYVVFPVVFLWMSRRTWSRTRQGAVLLVLCALVLVWRIVLVYAHDVDEVRTYLGTDTRVDGLLFGCAAALIANPAFLRTGSADDASRIPWASWRIGLLGFLVIIATLAMRDVGFRETVRYSVQSAAIVACLRYAIVSTGSSVFRLLNPRPVAWFGRMSYGFYLVHQIIIYVLEEHVSGTIAVLGLSLALSTGAAWGMHVLIERPTATVRSRALASLRQNRELVRSAAQ